MKKIKPYINCAVFIAGLIVIVTLCDFCFAQTGYINYILREVNAGEEDYDTIILGASHARSAIDPNVTDTYTQDNTLSMAIPGETMKDAYYVLKESCRKNHVKKVVLDVDYQYWFGPQEQGCFAEPFIYNQFSWASPTKWSYMIDNMHYLDIRNAISQRNVYLCTPLSVKTNVTQKLSDDYKNRNIYSLYVKDGAGPYKGRGFFYRNNIEGDPLGEGYLLTWIGREQGEIQEYPAKYFKRIKEYCEKNDIEFICVTSPIPPTSVKRLGLDVVDEKLRNYFDSLGGVTYYNFNKARMDVLERTDTDFADREGHMEGAFAEEYSAILGEVLKKHEDGTLKEQDYFYNTFDEFYKVIGE